MWKWNESRKKLIGFNINIFLTDSILQHGWVSGLTIPKVLISIQSLLTDPYTEVCMEPEIGRLYKTQRKMFDAVARIWTWKYAMWDALAAKPKGWYFKMCYILNICDRECTQ